MQWMVHLYVFSIEHFNFIKSGILTCTMLLIKKKNAISDFTHTSNNGMAILKHVVTQVHKGCYCI